MMPVRLLTVCALGGAVAAALTAPPAWAGAAALAKVNHFVVIYMENRSFDSMYGRFPGANGLANAAHAAPQVNRDDKPYEVLPPVMDTNRTPPGPDPRFPANLPNQPFDISPYIPMDQKTGDMTHRFYTNQIQIDGGKNDLFVAWSDAKALAMGYYDGSSLFHVGSLSSSLPAIR